MLTFRRHRLRKLVSHMPNREHSDVNCLRRFNHSLFRPIMPSERLKAFTVDELHALVFRLDVAETVEPLDEVAAELRDEMIGELRERDE
jgi:hypothetical protein